MHCALHRDFWIVLKVSRVTEASRYRHVTVPLSADKYPLHSTGLHPPLCPSDVYIEGQRDLYFAPHLPLQGPMPFTT
jgi:hypothetical protein